MIVKRNDLPEARRKMWLDAAKGIGITLVVLVHCQTLYESQNFLIEGYMPMFFVASGYSIKNSESLSIRKKAKSILCPYFLYNIILNFLVFISMKIAKGNFGIRGGAANRYDWYIIFKELFVSIG